MSALSQVSTVPLVGHPTHKYQPKSNLINSEIPNSLSNTGADVTLLFLPMREISSKTRAHVENTQNPWELTTLLACQRSQVQYQLKDWSIASESALGSDMSIVWVWNLTIENWLPQGKQFLSMRHEWDICEWGQSRPWTAFRISSSSSSLVSLWVAEVKPVESWVLVFLFFFLKKTTTCYLCCCLIGF